MSHLSSDGWGEREEVGRPVRLFGLSVKGSCRHRCRMTHCTHSVERMTRLCSSVTSPAVASLISRGSTALCAGDSCRGTDSTVSNGERHGEEQGDRTYSTLAVCALPAEPRLDRFDTARQHTRVSLAVPLYETLLRSFTRVFTY